VREAASSWFRARAPRERALLAVAGALALAIFGWIAVLSPFGHALARAQARYEAAAGALGLARAESVQSRRTDRAARRTPLPGPVAELLARAAEEAGFLNARIAARSATSASITIDSARAQTVFEWLRQIEGRGLRVSRLRSTANADRTVRIEATFDGMGP